MLFERICPPALLYLVFSITQIAIDSMKGLYNTALIKCWVTIVFTIILNYLCESGLGIISWIIVFIPFILMTLIVAILLLMFGLDPSTGKMKLDNGVFWHHTLIILMNKETIMKIQSFDAVLECRSDNMLIFCLLA